MKPFWLLSYRMEIKYVLFTFLLVLSIPFIAVILLTHAGIDIISDRLAEVNEENQTVELHNPDGSLYKEVELVISWPAKGVITLEFGQSSFFQPLHSGIDIANAKGRIGDPVTPFMKGTVIYAGQIFWGFGKHIVVDHGDNIHSVYAHLDKIFVIKGQQVEPGQVIAQMGTTGWSTGPHLHFQINVFGIPVNPRKFFL